MHQDVEAPVHFCVVSLFILRFSMKTETFTVPEKTQVRADQPVGYTKYAGKGAEAVFFLKKRSFKVTPLKDT